MKFLRSITAFLRKGAPGFSVLETALLDEIKLQLDADRAERLKRRVESVNLVQRLDGGREVNAYALENGKPVFDESSRLVVEDKARKLANFSFIGGDRISYTGAAWLVNGQLFSLEFDKSTEHVLDYYPNKVSISVCI